MKKYAIALLTLSLAPFAFAGSGQEDSTARLQAAGVVMNEIMAAPDKGIPEEVLNGAKCIAVVPSMAKGGFIVGGEHGRGVVTCRTAHGWSAPAFISIGGGNFGFQAGAQSVDLVVLFMNDKGVQGLLSSKFELSGEASADRRPSGTACIGRHRLEDEYGGLELLADQRPVCWSRRGWRQDPAGQRFHGRDLRQEDVSSARRCQATSTPQRAASRF